ncbi:16S rRNA (uracil(1498)-N(3))-methyltransferase [Priestia aryabhattai]|uniref:16S rRNA (uracil(1498)-N(3))-methyltransferase n=1 Tax=Priestia aryabhattai TaxID=412384 RepID=UPI003D2A4634
MQRYFLPNDQFQEQSVTVIQDDAHHISRVMRMNEGSQFIACNEQGQAALCEIENISANEVKASIIEWISEEKELPVHVTIVNGLPKGDKLELIIQKGTELGAYRFIPFIAARSVVKWDDKKSQKKVDRWNKIAKEAAEQSHRTIVPAVEAPISFKKLVEISGDYTHKVVAYEERAKQGETSHLHAVLSALKPGNSVLVVVGPEGGLTEQEVELLEENEFTISGFGPRILRAETAPLYALSAISYQTELMR